MVTTPDAVRVAQLEAENEALRLDGILKNLATKIGSIADPRNATVISPDAPLPLQDADTLWEFDKFARKLVGNLPKYETRKWVTYTITDGSDESGEITQGMQKLIDSAAPYFTEARTTARLYGGSAIVLAGNDGIEDYTQPLKKERLKSLKLIRVAEAGISQQLFVDEWGMNPLEEDYDKPRILRFNDTGNTRVHVSRLLLFNGLSVNARRSKEQYHGFGIPLLQVYKGELRDYKQPLETIAIALKDFNKLIVKLKNLVNMIDAKKKREIEQRLELYQYTSSVMSAFVGDPEDVIEYLNRSFAGVKEMVELLKADLGACADEPHTTFFNESPSGNTSGTDQMRNINSTVTNSQEDNIRKPLETLIDLWHHCQDSPTKGKPPESYELTFPVVYELNETERAALEKTQAERMAILLGRNSDGVINPLEAAEAIARDVPLSSVIDLDARQKAAKEIAEFEAEGLVVKKPEKETL
jgi:phage-related protein (TIGR01555 family)